MSGRTEDNVRDRNKLGTSLDMALMSQTRPRQVESRVI